MSINALTGTLSTTTASIESITWNQAPASSPIHPCPSKTVSSAATSAAFGAQAKSTTRATVLRPSDPTIEVGEMDS